MDYEYGTEEVESINQKSFCRVKKFLSRNYNCVLCGCNRESVFHALVQCRWAKNVWALLGDVVSLPT